MPLSRLVRTTRVLVQVAGSAVLSMLDRVRDSAETFEALDEADALSRKISKAAPHVVGFEDPSFVPVGFMSREAVEALRDPNALPGAPVKVGNIRETPSRPDPYPRGTFRGLYDGSSSVPKDEEKPIKSFREIAKAQGGLKGAANGMGSTSIASSSTGKLSDRVNRACYVQRLILDSDAPGEILVTSLKLGSEDINLGSSGMPLSAFMANTVSPIDLSDRLLLPGQSVVVTFTNIDSAGHTVSGGLKLEAVTPELHEKVWSKAMAGAAEAMIGHQRESKERVAEATAAVHRMRKLYDPQYDATDPEIEDDEVEVDEAELDSSTEHAPPSADISVSLVSAGPAPPPIDPNYERVDRMHIPNAPVTLSFHESTPGNSK